MNATCGLPPSSAYAWYDPESCSWKTYQLSLLQDTSALYSETWPRAGMMSDGVVYQRLKWEHRISEIGYGLWVSIPTATMTVQSEKVRNSNRLPQLAEIAANKEPRSTIIDRTRTLWPTPRVAVLTGKAKATKTHGWDLPAAVKDSLEMSPTVAWPTPISRDWRSGKASPATHNRNSRPLSEQVGKIEAGGQLNPMWVELLMGWPKGWTSLNSISMVEFQEWLRGFYHEEKTDGTQEVPVVQKSNDAQTICQRENGRLHDLAEEKTLQPVLRKPPPETDKARLQLESSQASPVCLRGMWRKEQVTRSPQKWRYNRQPSREYSNVVHPLSQIPSRYGAEAWLNGSWEYGITRTTIEATHRVDCLKAIGNGQVPLCAALAFLILANSES